MSQIPGTTGGNRHVGPLPIEGRILEGHTSAIRVATVGTAESLTKSSAKYHRITTSGNYTLTLPPEETSAGLSFTITCVGGGFTITINNDAAVAVVVDGLTDLEQVTVVCDGTNWYSMGIAAILLT